MCRADAVSSPANSSTPRVSAIILAAGASRRFGAAKLLTPLPGADGRNVLQVTVDGVLHCGFAQVIVVVGCYAVEMTTLLAGRPLQIVPNPRWEEGMSTSVRVGLEQVSPDSDAAMLMLADQPAVSPAIVHSLIEAYRETGAPIVAPVYGGRRGNPVLFDRRTFGALCQVAGDQGGRQVIASGQFEVKLVGVDDRAIIMDIDHQEDVSALSEYLRERGDT